MDAADWYGKGGRVRGYENWLPACSTDLLPDWDERTSVNSSKSFINGRRVQQEGLISGVVEVQYYYYDQKINTK